MSEKSALSFRKRMRELRRQIADQEEIIRDLGNELAASQAEIRYLKGELEKRNGC